MKVLQIVSQQARKFKKVQAKKLVKSNKSKKVLREIAFLAVFLVPKLIAIFEMAKNGIWSKKIIREIDLFDFTSFLAWTF